MRRISLNESDFKKLVRGEIVEQLDMQVSLLDVGEAALFNAVVDAIAGTTPFNACSLREDEEGIRRWIHGINQAQPTRPGGFLEAFAATVCRSDNSNYAILRPAILAFKAKFPQYRFEGKL